MTENKIETIFEQDKVEKYWNNVQPKIEHVFPKELEKEW